MVGQKAASAAFGPMGVVIGATVVALTAGAAAAVEMGTAAIDLTRHLGDITDRADELATLGAGLDDDDIQAIRDANQALDTLSATFDRLLVVVGTDAGFVGAMKQAAGAANGFFLLLEKNRETVQAFREDAKTLLMVLSGGYAQFDRIVGTVADGIDRLNQETADLQKTQERTAHLAREQQALAELQIEADTLQIEKEAEKAKAKQKSAKTGIDAAQKEFEARRKFFEEEDRIFFENQARQEAARESAAQAAAEAFHADQSMRAEAHLKLYQLQYDLEQQQTEAHQQAMRDRAEMTMQYAGQVEQIGEMLLQAEIARQGDLEGKSLTTQRKIFKMQKAADLASATISTARAVSAA